MYNPDTEILFPIRVIPQLKGLKGEAWGQLVDRLSRETAKKNEQYAFVLMMVRLSGCIGCNSDSFRAMRGCTQCARQSIRRYRGNDPELIQLFQQSCREVETYLNKNATEQH